MTDTIPLDDKLDKCPKLSVRNRGVGFVAPVLLGFAGSGSCSFAGVALLIFINTWLIS